MVSDAARATCSTENVPANAASHVGRVEESRQDPQVVFEGGHQGPLNTIGVMQNRSYLAVWLWSCLRRLPGRLLLPRVAFGKADYRGALPALARYCSRLYSGHNLAVCGASSGILQPHASTVSSSTLPCPILH